MPPASLPLRASDVTPGTPWLPVRLLASTDSTNAELARLAASDPRPWQVVVAEAQTAGRGRLERTWATPPGSSLAVSALVPVPATGAGWVPLVAGLAVHEAVRELTAGHAGGDREAVATSLKWPNDVLVPADEERKTAGILCELLSGAPPLVVVGAGINVTSTRAELPVDTATSLALAGAGAVPRAALLTAYLDRLAARLADLDRDPATVQAAYASACGTLGRAVEVHIGSEVRTGTAVAVDGEGRLVLDGPRERYAVAAGDVVHVRSGGRSA